MWNPDVYLTFGDERARPFFDLLSRVGAVSPRRVVDLGCGPGNSTELLIERLKDKIAVDFDTARRLFTLICVLHWKG